MSEEDERRHSKKTERKTTKAIGEKRKLEQLAGVSEWVAGVIIVHRAWNATGM